MLGASMHASTLPGSTSQNRAILSRTLEEISWSLRHTMKSGCTPTLRSSLTECCVGLVFTSWAAAMQGTSACENHVAGFFFLLELASSLDERLALDVAHRAADFGNNDIGVRLARDAIETLFNSALVT